MTMDDDAIEAEWQPIDAPDTGDYLDRIRVPGGWLYRNRLHKGPGLKLLAMTMVFVPDAVP